MTIAQRLADAGIEVKPLEWSSFGKEWIRAETALGRYEIMWGFANAQYALDVPRLARNHTWHPTLEAAKSAAQADYTARILSALQEVKP